ncbi:MAG: ornithine cyclodeaminase family protein [Halobacteriaceae archaeon]
MTSVLYLGPEDVEDLATPGEFVYAVRDAYRQRGQGAPAKPRTTLRNEDPPGMFTGYQAILPETGMGGYMYSAGFADSDAWFLAPLFDPETGDLLALVDGAWMNPYKTGATGAVAVDALAREDAASLAVLGSGPQARGQVRATATVRDLETVWVYSPTKSHRESFAAEFNERLDAAVAAVSSSGAAVEDADIVITATSSHEPVFDGDNLADGAHVTAMGQYHPDRREVDTSTVARATYIPDLRERVFQDAGAFLHAKAEGAVDDSHIHAELGDVVAHEAPGRTDAEEITLFDSGGTAIETVAGARLLYEKATEAGLGTELEWSPASESLTGR